MGGRHEIIDNGNGTLLISGICPISKEKWELKNIDKNKYLIWKFQNGKVQNVFPELNTNKRELLISGITEKGWQSLNNN